MKRSKMKQSKAKQVDAEALLEARMNPMGDDQVNLANLSAGSIRMC